MVCSKKCQAKKFIQVLTEQEFMAIFSIYNDMKEMKIFITIQSQGIPLNYIGGEISEHIANVQEGNVGMNDDNNVGVASEDLLCSQVVEEAIGEAFGDDVDEAGGEHVSEDVSEDVEAVGEVHEKVVGEVHEEVVGEVNEAATAEEVDGESDAVLSEDSFRSLKTDDNNLEENTDNIEAVSYDKNNPIIEPAGFFNFSDSTNIILFSFFNILLVKTLQGEHTCSFSNRCRNKVATQAWVCNRVIEWLWLEGDLSTSELRKRLQQNIMWT
uniref:Uncharacterized protein n=1 Tax=Ananas comosus var. bracteatus TaxID=296719 RepID=A0A6V7Q919_ANACO|nr:unnamed protein product [Ananas comosus var. bracteatus]